MYVIESQVTFHIKIKIKKVDLLTKIWWLGNFFFFYLFPSLFFFYCCSSIHVSIFSPPLPPTPAIPTSSPWCYPPLALSKSPLYMFLDKPSPFSPNVLSHFPSGYCQFVLYFTVSGSILLLWFFCCLGSTYR